MYSKIFIEDGPYFIYYYLLLVYLYRDKTSGLKVLTKIALIKSLRYQSTTN